MAEILFTSERFVKKATNISDNLAGKYLLPAIREAQEQHLRNILGDTLTAKLKTLLATEGTIDEDENARYKALLDRCQYYLAYEAIVEVTNKVSFKIGNFGVAKSNDENLEVASYDEIVKMQTYYQAKVDAYCSNLQGWLLENEKDFPELDEHQCTKISSNLRSAATCGIWLGGARGKRRDRR